MSSVTLITVCLSCGAPARYLYHPAQERVFQDERGEVNVGAVGALPANAHSLRLRLRVRNDEVDPWLVEARDQQVALEDGRRTRPSRSWCDGSEMPACVLLPGDSRTIELEYALPFASRSERTPARFVLEWRVATPARVLAQQSVGFVRQDAPPPTAPQIDPVTEEAQRAGRHDGMPPPGRTEATGWQRTRR